MKKLIIICSLLLSIKSFGQVKYYKYIDTLTIYKNGNRRIVIRDKVTFLNRKCVLNVDSVNVLNYYRGTANIIIDSIKYIK